MLVGVERAEFGNQRRGVREIAAVLAHVGVDFVFLFLRRRHISSRVYRSWEFVQSTNVQ